MTYVTPKNRLLGTQRAMLFEAECWRADGRALEAAALEHYARSIERTLRQMEEEGKR